MPHICLSSVCFPTLKSNLVFWLWIEYFGFLVIVRKKALFKTKHTHHSKPMLISMLAGVKWGYLGSGDGFSCTVCVSCADQYLTWVLIPLLTLTGGEAPDIGPLYFIAQWKRKMLSSAVQAVIGQLIGAQGPFVGSKTNDTNNKHTG